MPFDDESTIVHGQLIVPALEEVGYEVKRADSVIDQRSVLSDIVLGIDSADLIVADLTGLNPNVFYELGIAHGVGIPTVLITQSLDELPFDLRTYRASEYSTRFDEAEKLKAFLQEVGREAARGGVQFASPVSDFLPSSPAATRLKEVMSRSTRVPSARKQPDTEGPGDSEDEEEGEPGTLDLLHAFIDSSERATATLGNIGSETEAMGGKIEAHTERMQAAIHSSKPGSVAQVHRIATDVAKDLSSYGDALQRELPSLEDSSERMIESGIAWLARTGDQQEQEEVQSFRLNMATMYLAVAEAMRAMREYRDSFAGARGATSQLDKAADRVVGLLDRLLTSMETTQSFATRASDIAQEILGGGELHVVVEPEVECFADQSGSEVRPFSAVVLATFDRGVVERALPYVREQLLPKHAAVSWAQDESSRFPESWFVHPFSGVMERAWDDAAEFVGEPVASHH